MRPLISVLLVAFLSGCASSHMQQFVGQDIREVVMADGPPENVFDYGEGRRVFQFRWGGGTYVLPTTSQTTVNAYRLGSSVYGTATTTTLPARAIESEGCLLSYITEWVEVRDGWIVQEIRYPQRLVC